MWEDREYSKSEIREMILSWEIMNAVRIALEDSRVVLVLLELLREKDETVKTRALLAVNEILKRADEKIKVLIMKNGLDAIIEILHSGKESLSVKAAQVLTRLVDRLPLREEEAIKILDAVVPLIRKSRHELTLLEIAEFIKNLRILHPSPYLRSRITAFVSCRNPRIKAMGLRLLLNLFIYAGDTKALKLLLTEVPDLLSGDDVPLIEFSLDIIQDSLRLPVTDDTIEELPTLLVRVKNLVLKSRDFTIRMKARETLEEIERVIYEYYRMRPEEAKKRIHRLLLDGSIYEAIDLAIVVGDRYILEWLHEEIGKRGWTGVEFTPRFISGAPYIAVSGKKSKMKLPTLSELRSAKKPPAVPEPQVKIEDTEEVLTKAIEDEDAEALLELLKSNPDAIREISRMLKSDKIEEKIDGLWAVYTASSHLDRSGLVILRPLIPDLFTLLSSRNPWVRSRAAKILALLASEAQDGIVQEALKLLDSNPLSALEFFSYYFTYVWDEETAERVLSFLKHSLKDESLQFDALLTLDAVASRIPPDRIDLLIPFIPKLKRLREAPRESQKIAVRILDKILGR